MPDINFKRRFDKSGNVVYSTGYQQATGNKLLVNIFEKTFLSNIKLNDIFGDVYGGNATNFVGRSYNPDDINSVSALVSVAVDKTVESMLSDPEAANKPNTEKLDFADISSINITQEGNIAVEISVVPVEKEPVFRALLFIF